MLKQQVNTHIGSPAATSCPIIAFDSPTDLPIDEIIPDENTSHRSPIPEPIETGCEICGGGVEKTQMCKTCGSAQLNKLITKMWSGQQDG